VRNALKESGHSARRQEKEKVRRWEVDESISLGFSPFFELSFSINY